MNQEQRRREIGPEEPEIQQGNGRSIAKDEQLKRLIRQHPQRDEPRIDSVEPGEAPSR